MKKCLSFFSALILVFSSLSYASNLKDDLATKLAQLSQAQSFASFSLQLTADEEKLLAQIETNQTSEYNYYGVLPETKDISTFLQSLGNGNELSAASAKIISEKVQDIKESFNAEAVWVAIRSSHAVDVWSTPRWHTDGYMYSPFSGLQYKTAFILKGAGTLFCRLSDEGRLKFNEINNELAKVLWQYYKEGRPEDERNAKMAEYQYKLAKLIQDYKEQQQATIEQGAINHGAIFILGNEKAAAIHSEPHIDSDRLFVSVVTGTKEQINEHYEIQKKYNSK